MSPPLDPELAGLIDDAATATGEAKRAELIALAAMRAVRTVEVPAAGERTLAPLTKQQAARAIGASPSTLDRFVKQGAPFVVVGTRRRFDLAALRDWLAARGAKPTSPARKAIPDDPIDVTAALERAGLRASGACRQ